MERSISKDSWMDITAKFLHVQSEQIEDKTTGKKFIKEFIIFLRYHQLDVVRKLATDAKVRGAGKIFLIQHSAGSGKSNSISWLAYRLSSLHNQEDKRVFNSVIVVTIEKFWINNSRIIFTSLSIKQEWFKKLIRIRSN